MFSFLLLCSRFFSVFSVLFAMFSCFVLCFYVFFALCFADLFRFGCYCSSFFADGLPFFIWFSVFYLLCFFPFVLWFFCLFKYLSLFFFGYAVHMFLFRISSGFFYVFICFFWYVSFWTLTTPCFLAVGWGTMIYFSSIMCVLNAWRLAPLKQNQTIGNERQLAFSCILNIKTKSGNWAIKMSRQPFSKSIDPKTNCLHKHRNIYFLLAWSNDMCTTQTRQIKP